MATVKQPLSIGDAIPHATAIPELCKIDGTNYPVWGWAFSASVTESLSWRFKASNYGSGNVTVVIDWYSRSGSTSGSAIWSGALSVLTPGDAQSIETDGFATASTQSTAVNSTAKGLTRTSLVLSNLDSLATDDSVEFRLQRTDASIAGDLIIVGLEVQYSD